MAPSDKVAKTTLLYEVVGADKAAASAKAVAASSADLRAALGREITSYEDLVAAVTAYESGAKAAGSATRSATTEVTKEAAAVGALTKRLKEAEAAKRAAIDVGGIADDVRADAFGTGGGASTASRLNAAREAAIALPGVGFQSPIVLGLRAAQLAADKTGASMGELAVAGGLVGVAIGAVTIAMAAFNQSIDASKKRLEAAIGAQDAYYEAVGKLTSGEARQQLADLRAQQPALDQKAAEATNALNKAFADASSQFGDAGARALFATGAFSSLYDAQTKASQAAQTNADTITRLSQGLASGAFAAADMAAAVDVVSKAQLEAAQFAVTATVDSFNKRKDNIELEKRYLQAESDALAAQHTEEADKIKEEVDARIFLLGIQSDALDLFYQEIAARDALNQSLKTAAENSKIAADFVTQNSKDIAKAQADIAKAETDHQARLDQIAADAVEKREQIEADAAERETEIRADAAEKRADLETEYNEKSQEAEAEHRKRLAEIDQDFYEARDDAIANRDRAAFEAAQKQRKKQTDKENESYEEQRRKAQKAYDKQLAALEKATQKQLDTAAKAAQKQLDTQAKAAQKAIDTEVAKYNAEIAARQQAYNIALQQYQQFVNALQGIANKTVITPTGDTRTVTTPNVVNIGGDYNQQQARDAFAAYQRSQGVPLASGLAYVPRDNYLARLHRGERVMTANENRQYSYQQRRTTFVFQFDSQRMEVQSRRQAIRVLTDFVRAS